MPPGSTSTVCRLQRLFLRRVSGEGVLRSRTPASSAEPRSRCRSCSRRDGRTGRTRPPPAPSAAGTARSPTGSAASPVGGGSSPPGRALPSFLRANVSHWMRRWELKEGRPGDTLSPPPSPAAAPPRPRAALRVRLRVAQLAALIIRLLPSALGHRLHLGAQTALHGGQSGIPRYDGTGVRCRFLPGTAGFRGVLLPGAWGSAGSRCGGRALLLLLPPAPRVSVLRVVVGAAAEAFGLSPLLPLAGDGGDERDGRELAGRRLLPRRPRALGGRQRTV